jgi:hypothetical protein
MSIHRFASPLFTAFCAAFAALPAWSPAHAAEQLPTGPIGVAKVDITPEYPVRMYGYGARKTESEGVAGRLAASAVAIGGDEGEGPAVLLSVDNGAIPAELRAEVLRRVQAKVPLKPERFMLCNTHTHSGPDLKFMASITGAEHEHLARYEKEITAKLEQVVLQACASRRPGTLAWTTGTVGFATNRRVLKEGKWAGFGLIPDAPADRTLRLMRISDADGKVLAVLVNYACHNTTLRGNFKQIHGDWAGCAREFIQADHPGTVALIALGCGADSDPGPHGKVELCRQHGRAVADEVKRLLGSPMKTITPKVAAKMTTLQVPYCPTPPIDELRALVRKSFPGGPAADLLKLLEQGKKPRASEGYFFAAWTFGDDLAMVFLSNEMVVDYALRLGRELDAKRLWINAYCNDVSYYVVSDRLIKEGGYEVTNSLNALVSYGQPEKVQPSVEQHLVEAVRSLLPDGFRSSR